MSIKDLAIPNVTFQFTFNGKKSDILKFRLTTVFHSLYLIDKIYLRGILYGKQK